MKSQVTVLALALFGLFLGGCATAQRLNDVHIGMSKSDIIHLLGTPDSTSAQANVEYLTYYLDSSADGGYNRDRAYMVRLVDGKVESFGRFAQLFDLYNRPVTSAQPGEPGFPTAVNGVMAAPGPQQPVVQYRIQRPAAGGLADQLEKLKNLKDEGVITDEEFQRAKAKLLSAQ